MITQKFVVEVTCVTNRPVDEKKLEEFLMAYSSLGYYFNVYEKEKKKDEKV